MTLSRTGHSLQVLDAIEEIITELGHAQRLSQAGLLRRIRRGALKTLGKMEQAGRESGP
jgi:hypothetical protein